MSQPRKLVALKALLNNFADYTWLKVMNYSKSMMLSMNVPNEKMELLTHTFGSQIGSTPFLYLGLPLGLTKPFTQDFQPLVERIERRIVCCANFLT